MNRNIAKELLEENNDFEGASHLIDVEGMSSPRVCRLLNELVRSMDEGECYLEIGTWKGLTLLSSAYENRGRTCIGCDKFRFWGRHTSFGVLAKRALRRNLDRYADRSAAVIFHHSRSRRFFKTITLSQKVGVYFYDGDHSREGTCEGILSAEPLLARRSVVLVDDWNDPEIQKGTFDGLRKAGLRRLWERELEGDHSEQGWWNGLGLFYVERTGALG